MKKKDEERKMRTERETEWAHEKARRGTGKKVNQCLMKRINLIFWSSFQNLNGTLLSNFVAARGESNPVWIVQLSSLASNFPPVYFIRPWRRSTTWWVHRCISVRDAKCRWLDRGGFFFSSLHVPLSFLLIMEKDETIFIKIYILVCINNACAR